MWELNLRGRDWLRLRNMLYLFIHYMAQCSSAGIVVCFDTCFRTDAEASQLFHLTKEVVIGHVFYTIKTKSNISKSGSSRSIISFEATFGSFDTHGI